MIINSICRQAIRRIKSIKKCPCCKKRNFSSIWYYLLGADGYNGGDLVSLKNRVKCFQYVREMFKRCGSSKRLDLIAKKHCFNCGTDIDYNLLMYSRF